MTVLARFIRDTRAATAVEFALILPLFLMLFLGIIEGGRYLWDQNRAEKATQMGTRFAVATTVVPAGLVSANYVGQAVGAVTLTQGDRIPAAALGVVRCTSNEAGTTTTCSCASGPCPTLGTPDNAAFQRVVSRMRMFKNDIAPDNVIIEYSGSGLGYAGDPNGMDISPLVTVRLTGMQFRAFNPFFLNDAAMNGFAASLTMEDGNGNWSY
jgi:hypothetical protein